LADDDRRFPVRRIYCVGRNYAAHTVEMGGDPTREEPFFFMKPADCLVEDGQVLPYPPLTSELHHEVELVVALARGGVEIPVEQALDHVFGYAVGIDLTRRDLQQQAKDKRRPWDAGKGFLHSAPCGALRAAEGFGHPAEGAIRLEVNGAPRQDGDLAQMIWKVPEIIAYLSALFGLEAGDVIFTGTPAGVGPVGPGDRLTARVEGLPTLSVEIGAPA
jgi:fumarylpyruvate hydrolase